MSFFDKIKEIVTESDDDEYEDFPDVTVRIERNVFPSAHE